MEKSTYIWEEFIVNSEAKRSYVVYGHWDQVHKKSSFSLPDSKVKENKEKTHDLQWIGQGLLGACVDHIFKKFYGRTVSDSFLIRNLQSGPIQKDWAAFALPSCVMLFLFSCVRVRHCNFASCNFCHPFRYFNFHFTVCFIHDYEDTFSKKMYEFYFINCLCDFQCHLLNALAFHIQEFFRYNYYNLKTFILKEHISIFINVCDIIGRIMRNWWQ